MDVTSRSGRIRLILIAAAFLACRPPAPPGDLPPTAVTIRSIGQRLGRSCSERELTALATCGADLLGRLQPGERAALAHGYLRFNVDRPVVVDVAAPVASVPFWIADQGFQLTGLALENVDTSWRIYRKRFAPGVVGLGVNGLDRTALAHYVVFVRPEPEHEPAPGPPLVSFDHLSAPAWNLARAVPGASAARDAYRPFKSIPPELAGSTLLQPSHGNRHSTLLATGRVWKTHSVAVEKPTQVAISFGAHPATELVFTWTTSPAVETTCIRLARDSANGGDDPGPMQIVRGESIAVEVPNLLNDPIIRRHRVAVDRLLPDTVYRYSLGDGTASHWGPWRTVKTAPARSAGVSFLFLGDAQTGLQSWGRLLAAAHRRHPAIDFILLAGDLVDRGNERTNWDHFFLRAAGVFDCLPVMPCVGNHEYLDVGPRLYRAFFELPRNGPIGIAKGLVYHFEAGDACFAVLDSTLAAYDVAAAQQQAEWLDATLARTRASWKFVMLHHPIYPSHPWRDLPALRERFVPVFDKHHVDFVLQGHDHAYQRTYALKGHARARTPAGGTIYLMAVSGDKFVKSTERDYVEVRRSGVSTYQTFEIDPRSSRLTYRAWTAEGTLIDELSIAKRSQVDLAPDLARSR
jgi:predicted MPP superfamily phosphohydrolase